MKKLVTGILAMLLCFGCLAGCGDNADTSSSTPDASTPNASTPDTSTPDTSTPDTPADPAHPHEVDLADVKDYVFEQMSKKNLETRESFTVINTFSFIGAEEKYDIAWSLDVTEGVTITEGETEDTVVIAALDEDLPFTLTATITDPEGCHTTSFSLDCLAKAMPQIVPLAITEKPAENTAYKLYVYQSTLAKDLYFNGYDKAATYYFGTTENYEEAVDIYVEYIEGTDNFNLTFTYEDVKKYIGVRLSDDGAHDNIVATTEPVSSFFWSEELGTVLTHLDKNKNGEAADYYLGNYSTKDTISLSMTSYAGGAGNNVGGLVTMVDKSTIVIPDDKKVSDVKDALSVATAHTLDKTVELTTSDDRYPEVSIVWAVEEGKGASVTADGLVLAIPAEATTAVLTATVSCGEVTETKEFTLELGPKTVAPDKTNADAIVEAAFNLAAGEVLPGDNYTLTGVIKNVKTAYNPEHSNVTVVITVGDKEIECYRLKGEGADVIKAGDTITVTGILKNYNGTVEFDKDCSLDSYVAATPEEPGEGGDKVTVTVPVAITAAPVAGTAYKYYTYQSKKGIDCYITGEMDGYYFKTTENYAEGVDVYVEYVEGSTTEFYPYYLNGTAKKYIGVKVNGTYNNVVFADAPVSTFVWNETVGSITTTVSTGEFYLGNYNDFITFSASKISYASSAGNNVGKLCIMTEKEVENPGQGGSETPSEPEAPATVNKDDFNTLPPAGQYKTNTTPNGWTAENCAVLTGGEKDSNPVLPSLLGNDASVYAVCLNGKVSAPGKVTSSTISGGISKLSFNYGLAFSDTQFSITITIKDTAGNVVATKTLQQTGWTKYQTGEFTWELETPISGDFVIEIVNDCMGEQTGNKERIAIWNLTWWNA